jgi:hypothetical protein
MPFKTDLLYQPTDLDDARFRRYRGRRTRYC